MRKIKVILLLCMVSSVFISCASSKISSFVQADTQVSSTEKIAVFATTDDIELRKTIEKKFVSTFSAKKIKIVSAIQLIDPLSDYDHEDLMEVMVENDVKYLMVVEMPAEGIYQYPYVNYKVELYNVADDTLFYRANGHAVCDKVPEYSQAAGDLARKICTEYISFLRKPAKKDPLAGAGLNVPTGNTKADEAVEAESDADESEVEASDEEDEITDAEEDSEAEAEEL